MRTRERREEERNWRLKKIEGRGQMKENETGDKNKKKGDRK